MDDETPSEGSLPGMPGYGARLLRPDYWFFAPPKHGWRRVVVRVWALGMLTLMVASLALVLR